MLCQFKKTSGFGVFFFSCRESTRVGGERAGGQVEVDEG